MRTERSSSQTPAEFANTSSIKEQVLDALRDSKEYRCAFVEESIRTRITAQVKALRDAREWDYKQFAEQISKKVSWAYRLEDPNAAPPTIPTLLEVATAFDVGLDVRFRPFSELLDDVTALSPESFVVPSFEEEMKIGSFSQGRHRRRVRVSSSRRRPRGQRRSAEKPRYDGESRAVGANKPQALALAS
jgi:transcriptional regulator with XRE-family HTH domain